MILQDMSKPLTARHLNETASKRFGKRLNLEAFSNEQLYDARNRLRTRLHTAQTNENYNHLTNNEEYHRNSMFLKVINAEIKEREENTNETLTANDSDETWIKDFQNSDDPKFKGKSKEKRKQMALAAKRGKQNESRRSRGKRIVETAEDEAELIMAAKDMVDKLTGWMEHTAQMQTETVLSLSDAIRVEKGSRESSEFVNTVKPALESMYSVMEETRQKLISGVELLSGEKEYDLGDDGDDMDLDFGGDDFSSSEPAKGGNRPEGRARRESKRIRTNKGTLTEKKNLKKG